MSKTIALDRGREIGLAFLYWLTFLVALEPGNVMRAHGVGATMDWDQEIMRILGASLLGATSAPLLLALMRRFPIEGRTLWRHATIHTAGSAALAFTLILASCLLAVWLQVGDTRPVGVALPDQLAANWLLLTFVLAGFIALAHAVRFARPPSTAPSAEPRFATVIPVKARGRTTFIDVAAIDWIETQGNYLALHTRETTHLIRETSVSFEAKLNPADFARIHRRTLVARDRIRELVPLAGGDATLRLEGGTELRVSRSYRDKLRAAM